MSAKLGFQPAEIVFAPHTVCNLTCGHCVVTPTKKRLSIFAAQRFLNSLSKTKIKRVSFSGGEPFLYPRFLFALTKTAVLNNFFFGRITTNACWFQSCRQLTDTLTRLRTLGYDGDIAISFDAFHNQPIEKAAAFIKTAAAVFERPDFIWLTYCAGGRDKKTKAMILNLARELKLIQTNHVLRNDDLIMRINPIRLTPIGKARRLACSWNDTRWFTEDYCQGPGNIFYVMSDGSVKPCCGYANESTSLTIGNIYQNTAQEIINTKNKFVKIIFTRGLTYLKDQIHKHKIRFPGKTRNHCLFCHYLSTEIPKKILTKILTNP